MEKGETMCDLYRVKFTDKNGIERQYSGVTLEDVSRLFLNASLLKPFEVWEQKKFMAQHPLADFLQTEAEREHFRQILSAQKRTIQKTIQAARELIHQLNQESEHYSKEKKYNG